MKAHCWLGTRSRESRVPPSAEFRDTLQLVRAAPSTPPSSLQSWQQSHRPGEGRASSLGMAHPKEVSKPGVCSLQNSLHAKRESELSHWGPLSDTKWKITMNCCVNILLKTLILEAFGNWGECLEGEKDSLRKLPRHRKTRKMTPAPPQAPTVPISSHWGVWSSEERLGECLRFPFSHNHA